MAHAYQENFGNDRDYVPGRRPSQPKPDSYKERALFAARNASWRSPFLREIWRKFQNYPDGMTNDEANQVFEIVRELKSTPAPVAPLKPLPKRPANGIYSAHDVFRIFRDSGIKG